MHRRIVGIVLILLAGLWAGSGSLIAQVVVSGPAQMERCDEAFFSVAFTNPSLTQTACQIVFTNTAPPLNSDGFVYSESVTLPPGYELPPGETATVQFRLSTTCKALSGTHTTSVQYVECAQPSTLLQAADAPWVVEILPGAVTVTKTPSTPSAGVGEDVTWTLTVNSTGLGSIKNVVVWDVLGPGLTYDTSDPEGTFDPGTRKVTWALGTMAAGASESIQLTATVTACLGLTNEFDAQFGCDGGPVCADTSIDLGECGCGTATSSVMFIERLPFLTFSAPTITIPYCASTTPVEIVITNSGDGTAHDGRLLVDLAPLVVDLESVVGATYSAGCFLLLEDIPAGETCVLRFNVQLPESWDWCTGGPSGTPLYELSYKNDCGVTHLASPKFGSIGAEEAPSLTVSKTGPATAKFGSPVTYTITANYDGPTSCGSGSTTPVRVTDEIPDGFTVVDDGGGDWIPAIPATLEDPARGGVITWAFNPADPFSTDVTLKTLLKCDYCYTTQANKVTARATTCCGCLLEASSTVTTEITCESLYTSTLTLSPSSPLERCGDVVTFTNVHQFEDDVALDGVHFSDFAYSFIKDARLDYVADSAKAYIGGASATLTVDESDPTRLEFTVTDSRSVRGLALTYEFQMTATEALPSLACGGASFYVWAYHYLWPVGHCTESYDTAQLTIEAPSMSVGISGIPTIQEDCATYGPPGTLPPVTITLRRTSTTAQPYDAWLIITGTPYLLAALAQGTWTGVSAVKVTPGETDSVEWQFADGFAAPGSSATLTVPVTVPCGGASMSLAAQASFDDRCNNDLAYDDTCSTSASASASLRLFGDVYISKTPEVIYTTQRSVTWQIELYNSSNGTAYNVVVDDVLGSALAYASSSVSGYSSDSSVTTTPAGNEVSFGFGHIHPGERPVIVLTANLVSCSIPDMTNEATVGWGCGGDPCQTPRSDSSRVLVAPANVVSTSTVLPATIPACTTAKAKITLRSAGIATAYDLAATVTLPTGLVYAGNPEVRVGSGGWLPAGAPAGIPGPTLTWDKTLIPALAAVAPGVTVEIQFDVTAACNFNGGNLDVRTGYTNPCGTPFTSRAGTFILYSQKPALTVSTSQTSPALGQPIACDGLVTWTITVTNNGQATAPAVWVKETLGAGLTYELSTGGTGNKGSNSGQVTTWEILNLGVGSSSAAVLTITARSTSCGALTNDVEAYWTCGPQGEPSCPSSAFATETATRKPSVTASASLSSGSIGSCETQKTLTVTLSNASTSAPAYNPDVQVTLPAGLSYRALTAKVNCGSELLPAPEPVVSLQTLTWDNLCTSISAGGSVAVQFQVDAACYTTTRSAAIDLYYYDCCGTQWPSPTSYTAIAAVLPSLSVAMTPATASLDCADANSTVTWTITVENKGAATADFVRVVDTLGADLVHVSGGTFIDAQQWGWEFGPLAAGASEVVTLTARLAAPPNDCAVARRTSTAVATWGCTASPCQSGVSTQATVQVQVPDLSISSSDISPQFTCASDGISNGRVLLTVRNTGTAAISTDFSLTFSESTTGWSGSGTFTSLGGTLPLAAGGNRVLTLSGWPIACSSCSYQFTASLDTTNAICECNESVVNNSATLSYTPTAPDLVVASSALVPSCAGDGQVWVQGSVTLHNQGCGSRLTTSIPMRFTVYAGATCSGTVLDQWTQTFTGVSIAAGGGTQVFPIVARRTAYNACSLCQVSILIEADYSIPDAICECSGANNTFCATALPIAFPDLIVSNIDFAGLTCASDAISGSVAVTVTNQGCGDAGAFNVGLTTNDCLAFASQPVTSLAAGSSVVVQFPVATAWSGCGTCGCTFTATVDTGSGVCECSGANNTGIASYTSPLPDLVITAFTASAPSPCLPGSAQVTVRNSGCGTAPSGVVVGITVAATGQALTTVSLAAGESQTITVPLAAAVGCGTGYAVTATVDPANAVCECAGANNTASTTFGVSAPDLAVSNVNAVCNLDDTFTLTASVRNLGGQAASNVSIRVYADGVLVHDETQSIGATHSLSYVTPPLLCATTHVLRVVADEANAICECVETNNEATVGAALCPCPGLSTQKSITNVWRNGAASGRRRPSSRAT